MSARGCLGVFGFAVALWTLIVALIVVAWTVWPS